jgi:hypothetical protein
MDEEDDYKKEKDVYKDEKEEEDNFFTDNQEY